VGKPVALMADLQGPKIRVGKFAEGKVMLEGGAPFILDAQRTEPGDITAVGLDYKELPRDVKPGDVLLLNDGLIVLTVDSVRGDRCTRSSRSAASCPTTRASTRRAAASPRRR
jgi:pyruvate kinase